MGITKLQINIIFILLNSIIFVKSQDEIQNNEVETSNIIDEVKSFEDNLWRTISEYEKNIYRMEEQLKSMMKMFDQLEEKMNNMDIIEKTIEKTIEEQVANIDQLMEDKIENIISDKKIIDLTLEDQIKNFDKIMEKKLELFKQKYNLEELKCLYNLTYQQLKEDNNTSSTTSNQLKTLDGNWTVVQRRQDGSVNFNRNWTEYAEGFGDPDGEFFIGLNKLHNLTSSGDPQELYIMLEDYEGRKSFAKYGVFQIDSESNGFKITVDDYTGDAGDSLGYHNGMKFSTYDRDNDLSEDENCAEMWESGWWYRKCYQCNLNGQYFGEYSGEHIEEEGEGVPPGEVNWISFGGVNSSLKYTQMMIRPKQQ